MGIENLSSVILLVFLLHLTADAERAKFLEKSKIGVFAAEKIIEKIQNRMRYGFPQVSIPPLVPLKMSDRNNTISLSFITFNTSVNNILIDGIDKFSINHVKFNWRNKSMNFSLTFHDLQTNGSYIGSGNFINYIPIRGKGDYNFNIYNLTTNVVTYLSIKRFRMQIFNFTAVTKMQKFKSNITNLNGGNRWSTRSINKIINRLVEFAAPRVFDINQRLINYTIDQVIVPRVNRILTMFSIVIPSTKSDVNSMDMFKDEPKIYLRELDNKTIAAFLKKYPIPIHQPDNKFINMLFNDKYFDLKI